MVAMLWWHSDMSTSAETFVAQNTFGWISACLSFRVVAWPVMASFNGPRTSGPMTSELSCLRPQMAGYWGSVAPNADGLDAGDGQGRDNGDDQVCLQSGAGQTSTIGLILEGLLAIPTIAG